VGSSSTLFESIITNCRIRMLGGDPGEDFLPVGSGEMCPHLSTAKKTFNLKVRVGEIILSIAIYLCFCKSLLLN
jgi:hypothetical protein